MLDSEIINIAPEYEDCKKLADEQSVALKEIYHAAIAAVRQGAGASSPC
jgi:uncharacterized protein (DUF111 family)